MLRNKVLATIRRYAMLEPGDRTVVAVSGGPDSMALLHLLVELREELPLSLVVAHLDHGLRGEDSAKDAAFVGATAERLGLAFAAGQTDVATLARRENRSIEEAGRVARRRFLRDVAGQTGARRIALGHHRDDQAESVLLRLIGGSGRGGLSGIRPVSEQLFVRPLFDCARTELLEYLGSREIPFRTDATNEDTRFPRNRLRHTLMPLLREEFNPRVVEAIARTAEILRGEDALLDRLARRALRRLLVQEPAGVAEGGERPAAAATPAPDRAAPSRRASRAGRRAALEEAPPDRAPEAAAALARRAVALEAPGLAGLDRSLGRRVVRLALRRAGLAGRDLPGARIDEVLALAAGGVHASLSLGEAFTARYEYGRLVIEPGATARRRGANHAAGPGPQGPAKETFSAAPGETGMEIHPAAPGSPRSGGGGAAPHPNAIESARGLREPAASESEGARHLALPGETVFPALGLAIRSRVVPRSEVEPEYRHALAGRAYLDAAQLTAPLLVRRPLPGDRFRPLGAPGSRKLSDLWTDMKVPRARRDSTLVVASGGRIVWAAGLRIAHEFRVTAGTRKVAVLDVARTSALPAEGSARGGETPGPVLYSADEISAAVARLAADVTAWAAGREILVLGILHGSFIFVADLVRRLTVPCRIGFLGREGNPVFRPGAIEGALVVVAEDILDTGESLTRVLRQLREHRPSELRTCVLFDKPAGRKVQVTPDWAGLLVPDRWVVGYGLDQEGLFRNLPFLTFV